MSTKEKKAKKRGHKGRIAALAFGLAFVIAFNIAAQIFSGYIDLFLGRGEAIIIKTEGTDAWDSDYYTLDYDGKKDLLQAANALVEEIEGEGIVLLKNNGTLPLKNGASVTLMGRDAADPVYGGSGSGAVKLDSVVNLKDGMQNAGFKVNETVYNLLADFAATAGKTAIAMDKPEDNVFTIGEMPVSGYTQEALNSFAQYRDAAIVMLGRGGGEGGDLTKDMKGWDNNYTDGQHQLELNHDEKQAIALAKEKFDTVVVIINSSNAMELGELEADADIDAILWIGAPGQTGFNAVGNVLSGAVNPSGKLPDIYPTDFTKDPTFVNFGSYQYSNINASNSGGNGYFVQYEEGIYIGYKYYETAAAEGFIDYDSAVVYPFGYGLSYTDFAWEMADKRMGEVDGSIEIDVKVTNTGSVAGKEVVQLYYSAPYTKGGIEKSAVVLGDFAKTQQLAPGESETVTLALAVEDMASYDYITSKAYVLEAGDYGLALQTDSHNVKDGCEPIAYTVGKTVVYDGDDHRASDQTTVTNQFDDVSAELKTVMSRADFAGTFPTAPGGDDMVASEAVVAAFAPYKAADHIDAEAEKPTTGDKNGLSLIDLRGAAYDDPTWELLLDQLKPDEMEEMLINGAYNNAALKSVAKPAAVDYDGPSGLNSYMTSLSCTAYPCEPIVAATFNTDLARAMGEMVGNEGLANKVNGWYAPAVNMHRSQFAGRNFEYYSEDPLLSGKMGAACVEGTASKGMYAYLKHFVLNDQETNRVNNGVATFATEQAMREIYLKPFEYIVKNATQTVKYISDSEGTVSETEMKACTALMSCFNRVGGVWGGGSEALMQTVLRDEWGFEGAVITDFNLYSYMYADQGIAAGSDLMLTYSSMKSFEDTKSATAVANMRQATKNILYTIANSNAMNGIVPGSIITYTKAPWQTGLLIFNTVFGVVWVLLAVLLVVKIGKTKKQPAKVLANTDETPANKTD